MQSATLAVVAPPIAEALIATAMGLFAAIPAVIAYNRYADKVVRLEIPLRRLHGGVLQHPAAARARQTEGCEMATPLKKRKLMAEINVVPYIDVMLVLLVIFMVTAPLLTQGVKVELPKAGAEPIQDVPDHPPLVVSVDAAATSTSISATTRMSRPARQGDCCAGRRGTAQSAGDAGSGESRPRRTLRQRRGRHGAVAAGWC